MWVQGSYQSLMFHRKREVHNIDTLAKAVRHALMGGHWHLKRLSGSSPLCTAGLVTRKEVAKLELLIPTEMMGESQNNRSQHQLKFMT